MFPEKEEFEKNPLSEHIHAHPAHNQNIEHILQQNDGGDGIFSWLFSSFDSSSSHSIDSSSIDSSSIDSSSIDSSSSCSDLSSSNSSDSSSSLDLSLCSDLLFNVPL